MVYVRRVKRSHGYDGKLALLHWLFTGPRTTGLARSSSESRLVFFLKNVGGIEMTATWRFRCNRMAAVAPFLLLLLGSPQIEAGATSNAYEAAQTAYEQGDYNRARKKALLAIDQPSTSIPARLLLINIYVAQGRDSKVLASAEEIPVSEFRTNTTARDAFIEVLARLGRDEELANLRYDLGNDAINRARQSSNGARLELFSEAEEWFETIGASVNLVADAKYIPVRILEIHFETGQIDDIRVDLEKVATERMDIKDSRRVLQFLLDSGLEAEASKLAKQQFKFLDDERGNQASKCLEDDPGWLPTYLGTGESESSDGQYSGYALNPVRYYYVRPEYPELARTARLQSQLILEILIQADGTIGDVKVLQSERLNMGLEIGRAHV